MDEATSGGESEASETAAVETPAASGSAPHTYDSAALDSARYRLTDLIPVRIWTLSVLTLGGLALVAGIESLYGGVLHSGSIALPASALSALDVAAAGSLAAWFSSLLLTSAAAASWLVYALRRHRVDDYRGTYRIWLWAGAALFLTSIDATCRCHEILRELMPQLTGTPLLGDGTVWWMMLYGLVLGGLAIRMLVEMRRCRSATTVGILAGVCYALAASLHLGWPPLDGDVLEAMLHSSLVLLGHGGVLLSVMLYARHVLLDAQGRIPPRPKRARRPAQAPKPPAEPRAKRGKGTRVDGTRIDGAHATGTSGRRRRGGSDETADQAASDGDEDLASDANSRTARRERPQRGSASSPNSSAPNSSGPNSSTPNSSAAGPSNGRSADAKPIRGKEPPTDAMSSAGTASSKSSSQPSSGRAGGAKPPLDVKRRSSDAVRSYDDDLGDGDMADQGDDDTAGLSKAERRRLRKMKRRQQA
jgi:hypothetical protein